MNQRINFKGARDDEPVSHANPLPVGGLSYVDVTLSADTGIMASGDIIADTQVVTNALRANNTLGILSSVVVIDEDDQGAALDLYFFSANASLGTENNGPSITDANARNFLGFVPIGTGDYKDLGGVKVAFINAVGMIVKAATDTRDIYVGVVNGTGTPTYTASGLKLRLGFLPA